MRRLLTILALVAGLNISALAAPAVCSATASAQATLSCTLNVSAHSTAILFCHAGGASITIAFSDGAGNTWNATNNTYDGSVGNSAVAWASAGTAAPTNTVTCTFPGSPSFEGILAIDETTPLASSPLDALSGFTGTGNVTTVTESVTTTQANDLIVMAATQANTDSAPTAGTGYTMQVTNSVTTDGLEDGTTATVGSVSASMVSTASAAWVGFVLAFKTGTPPATMVPRHGASICCEPPQ
jgi:hypothetical protein